ncbi:hypothetical protein ACFQS7_22465 [Dankookia sp. GCM10030260]|uniref:hypothetical protein n=1 Tax=Dankookia sp. GCM10030260 TaxID=3273390 RepID=UPI00360E4378
MIDLGPLEDPNSEGTRPGGVGLPTVIERIVPIDPLARFGSAYLKRMASPLRAFAAAKALMLASFAGMQVAGQLDFVGAAGQAVTRIVLTDPSLGQMMVCAGTVVLLAGANLVAFVRFQKGIEQRRDAYLRLAATPGLSPCLISKIIEKADA